MTSIHFSISHPFFFKLLILCRVTGSYTSNRIVLNQTFKVHLYIWGCITDINTGDAMIMKITSKTCPTALCWELNQEWCFHDTESFISAVSLCAVTRLKTASISQLFHGVQFVSCHSKRFDSVTNEESVIDNGLFFLPLVLPNKD